MAAANATLRGGNGGGGWGVTEIFETYNTIAPAVTLTCEDYGLVFRLAENNQKPVLSLDLDAELPGEQPAFNAIAMIKGSEKPDEYVILSAPVGPFTRAGGCDPRRAGQRQAAAGRIASSFGSPRPGLWRPLPCSPQSGHEHEQPGCHQRPA